VSAGGLREALRTTAPRAVLITGYNPHFNRAAFYEAWRARRPILFRAETTDHAKRRDPIKTFIRDRALQLSYAKSARLLYIGQRSQQHYQRLKCEDEKLIFSPYCVDTSPFNCSEDGRASLRSITRQELGVREGELLLLFSGKLSERKRPDLILHAVKLLPAAIRERIATMFLGSGELAGGLRQLALSAPRITAFFPGFKNQTQLSAYYHAADLLVLPSRVGETWGLVVNEALHHGLPCVVSEDVGCAPDLIEPDVTGCTFRTDSAESLAAALQQVLPLVGRQESRAECRRRIDQYTVEAAARGIAQAYHEVANVGHKGAGTGGAKSPEVWNSTRDF
jgi:glycosyltransferase involved in cell wall biosynthesis